MALADVDGLRVPEGHVDQRAIKWTSKDLIQTPQYTARYNPDPYTTRA